MKIYTFVNLTPHQVVLCGQVVPPSGSIARVAVTRTHYGTHGGVPMFLSEYGEVTVAGEITAIPERTSDTMYIVSAMVRLALSSRIDIGSPADLVRDGAGNIVGANSLDVNCGY